MAARVTVYHTYATCLTFKAERRRYITLVQQAIVACICRAYNYKMLLYHLLFSRSLEYQ